MILCVFWEEKEEDECVRENLILMCGKGWFMEKKSVQTRSMEESCM